MPLGINTKILKSAKDDDIITLKLVMALMYSIWYKLRVCLLCVVLVCSYADNDAYV